MNYKKYKHKITETVKFHEIDMMGVVNNAVYFNYFEDARMDYLQFLHLFMVFPFIYVAMQVSCHTPTN